MRLLFSLVAIGALSHGALAGQPDCKAIADPASRLTCYDRINPPLATYPIPLPKPIERPAPEAAMSGGAGDLDTAGDGEALMNEKIHGICRGC
ncbi:hypothetical protein [Bradyrhizobium sp.]|uniref:hypothetical protein n=1 Tax=Bradyrhizobium sp. TaxID=376 RepID=UPI003C317B20